jgi:hypothetical protein
LVAGIIMATLPYHQVLVGIQERLVKFPVLPTPQAAVGFMLAVEALELQAEQVAQEAQDYLLAVLVMSIVQVAVEVAILRQDPRQEVVTAALAVQAVAAAVALATSQQQSPVAVAALVAF